MQDKTVILLHGYASSAMSRKALFLGDKFSSYPRLKFHAVDFNPTPRDFEYMTITGMINRLRQCVLDREPSELYLIGSSLGALVGLHYAHRYGGVSRMLHLAPALTYSGGLSETSAEAWAADGITEVHHFAFERPVPLRFDMHQDGMMYQDPVPPASPVLIIHGRSDAVVSVENSRRYAADYAKNAHLLEVESDHRLSDQMDFIWQSLRRFFLLS